MPASATVAKRLDHIFDKDTETWLYRDTAHEPSPLVLPGGKIPDGTDVWKDCCFVVVREVPVDPDSIEEPHVNVTIKTSHLQWHAKKTPAPVLALVRENCVKTRDTALLLHSVQTECPSIVGDV